jgi:O-antigen/teichoic acid export membrane protein
MRLSVFKKMVGARAFKDASVLGLAHVLTLLLGLASTVVWTRWMPAETFGQYKVVLGVISIAGTFCLLGIGQVALMSAASKADGNLPRLIRSKLLANVGGALLILAAAGYYSLFRPDSGALVGGLVAAAIIFPIYNSSELWLSWLNGKGKFGSLAAGRLTTSGLALCAALLIVLFHINEVWLVVLLFLALPSVQNVLMLRRAVSLKGNDEHNESLMRLGRHTSFALIFVSLLSLDVVLLEHFHKAEEVALYVVALAFPEQVKGLFSIIGQVIAPKIFANESLAKLWPSFRKKFFGITLVFTGLGLIGFILIPILVPLLFTAKYAAAADYGKWLWLAISCTGSFTCLGSALIGTGRPTYIYTPSVGYPLCLLTLYLVFLDYGASGMIYARSVSAILLAAYYGVAFALELRSQKMSVNSTEN